MSEEFVTRLGKIPGATALEKHSDGWWMDAPQLDVLTMARTLNGLGARFSTASGVALSDGETQIIYHYALGRNAINLKTRTRDHAIASITPITRAANWIEREIHDLFAVEFVGHPNLVRLIRPPQLAEGFYRTVGNARNTSVPNP